MVDEDISDILIKSDIKFYLKSFKEMVDNGFLTENEYENISKLIFSKFTVNVHNTKPIEKDKFTSEDQAPKPKTKKSEKQIKPDKIEMKNVIINNKDEIEKAHSKSKNSSVIRPLFMFTACFLIGFIHLFARSNYELSLRLSESSFGGTIAGVMGLIIYLIYILIKKNFLVRVIRSKANNKIENIRMCH
jgi:hypothetical protein